MRLFLKTGVDHLLEIRGQVEGVGKRETPCLDFSIRLFHVLGLEGRPPVCECVADDSETPNIDLAAMALGFEDFRGNVVGGAANGFPLFARIFQFGGEPEIAHLDFHILVEEEVAQLEVSVDNLFAMEILQRMEDLQ